MFVSICSGPRFEQTSAVIMLPDDCTVGFIVERRLGISMVHSKMFHSHLENLLLLAPSDIPKQVRWLSFPPDFLMVAIILLIYLSIKVLLQKLLIVRSFLLTRNGQKQSKLGFRWSFFFFYLYLVLEVSFDFIS